jgi:hypothetical protein
LTSFAGNSQSAAAARVAGQRAQVAAQFEAAQLEQNAGQAIAVSQAQAKEQLRQTRLLQSRAIAVTAAGGGGVTPEPPSSPDAAATPGLVLTPDQQAAAATFASWLAASADGTPFVLRGYAGTGKTFLCMNLLAQVEAAARLVGVHDLIVSLPQGYNSPVGRDGTMLSGGQRQRVGLARALYGKPVFVVLDEPNSSLDEAGDAALAHAISALKQLGTTFVVMTHRTSVLGVADKMLIMRDGAQQAFGPRDEVLAALQQKAKS